MGSQYLQNGHATLTTFWSTHWSDAGPGKVFFFFLPITSGVFSEAPEMVPDWWRKGVWHAGVPRWACQTPAMGPAVRSCSQAQGTANSSCGLRKELFSLGRLAQASRGSLLLLQHWAQPPCLAPPGHFRSVIPHFAEPEEIQLCPWSLQHSSPWQFVFLVFSHL